MGRYHHHDHHHWLTGAVSNIADAAPILANKHTDTHVLCSILWWRRLLGLLGCLCLCITKARHHHHHNHQLTLTLIIFIISIISINTISIISAFRLVSASSACCCCCCDCRSGFKLQLCYALQLIDQRENSFSPLPSFPTCTIHQNLPTISSTSFPW